MKNLATFIMAVIVSGFLVNSFAQKLRNPTEKKEVAPADDILAVDANHDGLWDEEYQLFEYALEKSNVSAPKGIDEMHIKIAREYRKSLGLPRWADMTADQQLYFSAMYWHRQEDLASFKNPARTLELARSSHSWIQCYEAFGLPVGTASALVDFLGNLMLSRASSARSKAQSQSNNNIIGLTSQLPEPLPAEACRKILRSLPFQTAK
ncbi:MAG: hypothetical protein ACXWR4_03265 [Bdellovibrionota bacterium]